MDHQDPRPGEMERATRTGVSRPGYPSVHFGQIQAQMRRMDSLLGRLFGYDPSLWAFGNGIQQDEPDADIYESDTEYILHVALPGIEPDDIQIEATEERILLLGQRRPPFQREPRPNDTRETLPGAQVAEGDASQPGAAVSQPPHTQHRQSRYSSQWQLRMVYTLPSPIDTNGVSAEFRNGVLDLRLPKQRRTFARAITIKVQTGSSAPVINTAPDAGRGSQPAPATLSASSGTHEGAPANKMGADYTPSAGEDHTAQTQSIGTRFEHHPGREGGPIGEGQMRPVGSPAPASETNRS